MMFLVQRTRDDAECDDVVNLFVTSDEELAKNFVDAANAEAKLANDEKIGHSMAYTFEARRTDLEARRGKILLSDPSLVTATYSDLSYFSYNYVEIEMR